MLDGFVPSTTDISSFQTLIAVLADPKAIQQVLADMRDLATRAETTNAEADAKQQATADEIERLEKLKAETDRRIAEADYKNVRLDLREKAAASRDHTQHEREQHLAKREGDLVEREQKLERAEAAHKQRIAAIVSAAA